MSIHHPDHEPYRQFTKRQRVDKAVQTLQGMIRGITIDGELNAEEVAELLNWTREYAELIGRAPFNELKAKLDEIMADGQIDPEEQEDLLWVCRNLTPESEYYDGITHDIQQLHGRVFTFTGTSTKATRKQIADQITGLGANFSPNVTSQTQYLVVGAGGNPCWAFSCYGRKVQKAVDFRKSGVPILVVHESDFWDAVADNK